MSTATSPSSSRIKKQRFRPIVCKASEPERRSSRNLVVSLPPSSFSSPTDTFEPSHDPWNDDFTSFSRSSSTSTSQTSLSSHSVSYTHPVKPISADHYRKSASIQRCQLGMSGVAGSSLNGLDGSWRMEGSQDLPSTLSYNPSPSFRHGPELVWDINANHSGLIGNVGSTTSVPGPVKKARSRSSSPIRSADYPLPTAVWANVMDTSRGRDKVLKCFQYSLKTYVYLLGLIAGVRPLNKWFRANSKRMKLAASGLSLTRKCLLLLNPLHPITELLSPTPTSATTLIGHMIDLCSAISDDIYCLFRLGIVGKRTGKIAEDWSSRFWLLTTLMGLYKLHLRTLPKLRRNSLEPPLGGEEYPVLKSKELIDAEWTNRKLLADLIFVSFDVFEFEWFKEPIQCFTGLSAAFISTSKLYDQHWRASLGKG